MKNREIIKPLRLIGIIISTLFLVVFFCSSWGMMLVGPMSLDYFSSPIHLLTIGFLLLFLYLGEIKPWKQVPFIITYYFLATAGIWTGGTASLFWKTGILLIAVFWICLFFSERKAKV